MSLKPDHLLQDTVVSSHTNNAYPEINTKVKPNDKDLFYHFNSFIPDAYKNNLMYCLISRMYRIASSYTIFPPDGDLIKLKNKFLKTASNHTCSILLLNAFLIISINLEPCH